MVALNVRLFGGFDVRRSAGPSILFPTRKARALFAVLARHPGAPQPREALAAMLWPESAEPEARSSLRQALKLVRGALVDVDEAVVLNDGDLIVLAPGAAEVDVELFERLHGEGTAEALERAGALYRGDFLEGMNLADGPFADWSLVERQRLRERALDVFSRLVAQQVDVGERARAIDTALRLLAFDPLQENVHRRLIELYLGQGRPGAALEQYRLCRAILERELGVPPEPETERLHQEIRRRRVRVGSPAPDREPPAQAPSSPAKATTALLARPAVAVLPFANIGGDPAETYFSDGLSEDLITALAGWRCFPVIASSSTLACRDERHDPRVLAASLDARYLVDGSVRRAGTRLRVTARLMESEGGRHLWVERFDFELHDILAVQEEAAQRIAAVVEPELERAELGRIVRKHARDLTAWDHCLRGTSHLHRRTHEDNALARASFEQALQLDPEYGDAFTGLAFGHLWDIQDAAPGEREALVTKAIETARHAVAQDYESSMAHLALGTAHVWAEELDVAMPETELAIELNPSNAFARMALGNRLDLMGRTEQGIAQMERSLRLNPRDTCRFRYMGFLARAHLSVGHYEDALAWARKALQLRPEDPDTHYRLAVCLAHLDRVDAARAALKQSERLRPGFLDSRKDWRPYAEAGRNEHFFAGLQRHRLLG